MGDTVQNRTYHGLPEEDKHGGRRIAVEEYGGGPTERERSKVLYEVDNQRGYYGPRAFWWGYSGTNPHDTATEILRDALGERPPREMVQAFAKDAVSHLCTEWRKSEKGDNNDGDVGYCGKREDPRCPRWA